MGIKFGRKGQYSFIFLTGAIYMYDIVWTLCMSRKTCDSMIGTLLNIKGKIKDGLKCHQDLVGMGIRDQFHEVIEHIFRQHVTQCQRQRIKVFVIV